MYRLLILFGFLLAIVFTNGQTTEFVGPFRGWTNLKTKYGAKGDGKKDDTEAIQKALNDLDLYKNPVLFIPAGTYKITRMLEIRSKISVSIFGEDPQTTIIKWHGEKNGTMFLVDGVTLAQYGRLTWDGSNKAQDAILFQFDIRQTKTHANIGSEVSDMIFRDVAFGIRTGGLFPDGKYGQDSECTVLRCRFYNCSVAGISIADWNDLDWYTWNNWFEDCTIGITNDALDGGAGNFYVYQSCFLRSTDADIKIGVANFYSLRHNISKDSKKFLQVSRGWNTNGSLVTIQGNKIYDTRDPYAVWMVTKGNILFIDNVITNQVHPTGPVLLYKSDAEKNLPDFVSLGNSFTVKKYYDIEARFLQADDKVVSQLVFDTSTFKPYPFLRRAEREVFEVHASFRTEEIQQILNKAYKLKGQKPVVHFNYGIYSIDKTLHIPPSADMQLIGDAAFSSRLDWSGQTKGPVLLIEPDSKIQMANLYFIGNKKADIIWIKDNDKPGNIFYAEQLVSNSSLQTGVDIKSFSNTSFYFTSLYHVQHKNSSFRIEGNKAGKNSFVNIIGNCASGNQPSFEVIRGGKLLVADTWYEGGEAAHFSKVKDNSTLLLNGALIAIGKKKAKETIFDAAEFNGSLSISQTAFRLPEPSLSFEKNTAQAKLLLLGCLNYGQDSNFVRFNRSNINIGVVNSRFIKRGSAPSLNTGNVSLTFIKTMLDPLRKNLPMQVSSLTPSGSAIRLFRINLSEGLINLKIIKSS